MLSYFADNAAEMTSRAQRRRLERARIKLETCTPNEHAQNGIVERMNRKLLDQARLLLHSSGLAIDFWPWAFSFSAFLLNRTPTTANQGDSPYKRYYGVEPCLKRLRIFGSKCWVFAELSFRALAR